MDCVREIDVRAGSWFHLPGLRRSLRLQGPVRCGKAGTWAEELVHPLWAVFLEGQARMARRREK